MANELNSLYDKYFKEEADGSLIFNGERLIVRIPPYFYESGVTRVNQTIVETLGIFEGLIFDDSDEDDLTKFSHKFTMKLPANIIMKPSHINDSIQIVEEVENETLKKEKSIDLVFLKGDTFIVNVNIVQDLDVSDKYIDILLKAHMPKTITYEELAILWQKCAAINGSGDLESNLATFELICMNLTRDPKDYTVLFRNVYEKYYAAGIKNGTMINYEHIPKYTSGFTSLTSWDPKYGITVAMEHTRGENKKDIVSPIEEAIK